MGFPELAVGGYSRVDGNVAFYGRVQAILCELDLHPPVTVVDFGAGRGLLADDPVPYRRRLQELRAPGRTVIGVDIDPVVKVNPRVDEARVIEGLSLPIDSESVDIIVSDFTWEHLDDPAAVARELERVLRPGGWICARTPNRWGYIALGARLVPNALHVAALRRFQPTKLPEDTFPTRYRLNTRGAFHRHFPSSRFEVHAFTIDAEPYLYAGRSKLLGVLLSALHRAPAPFKSMWNVFIHKHEGQRPAG
jgi:SAM-dependent methyltransferase